MFIINYEVAWYILNLVKNDNRELQQRMLQLRDYKVVKSNDLIQKSRFLLSLQEQKIILFIISKIKPNDENFFTLNFSIQEFCKVCGIDETNGKNYKNIKDTIKSLSDKSVWLKLENDTETLVRWINKAWISSKSGSIEIRIDDDMKPYLLQLQERFTQYELLYTLAMRSQYSIRLYELLKSYEYQHKKIFDIDELKRLLSAENYIRFPDFKRKVLDIAFRELNDLSDMTVSYRIIKEGRRFAKIEFSMRIKKELDERLKTWARIDKVICPSQQSLYDKIYSDNVD